MRKRYTEKEKISIKKYYEAHKEKINEYSRNYYKNNKEKLVKQAKEYTIKNKEKIKQVKSEYHQKNKEERNRKGREYYHKNIDKVRDHILKKKYGITLIDFMLVFYLQDNKCAICQTNLELYGRKTCVDHCHITGKFRGILCQRCNRGLGMIGETPEIIKRAYDYINNCGLLQAAPELANKLPVPPSPPYRE